MFSEIRGLGEEYCIYCGTKIPGFVIPTEEGRAKESILSLLLQEIEKAQVIIFVGYGFGDTHIMADIKNKINSSQGEGKIIINFCLTKINESKELKKLKNPYDITYKLPHSIDYANWKLSENWESEIGVLHETFKKIFETYQKVIQ